MNEQEKWEYINELDEEFLIGNVILSEWSVFLTRDAETAFWEAIMANTMNSNIEIEARFLTCGDSWRGKGTAVEIYQGYLANTKGYKN